MPVFHYDSREHHQPLTRSKRFYAFLIALGSIIIAGAMLFFAGREWSSEGSHSSFLRVFLIGSLLGLAILIVSWLVRKKSKWGYTHYQTLTVDDENISWLLNKQDGAQSVAIADIKYAVLDIRHLMLKLNDNQEAWIENYTLMDRESQWNDFVSAVRERVEVK